MKYFQFWKLTFKRFRKPFIISYSISKASNLILYNSETFHFQHYLTLNAFSLKLIDMKCFRLNFLFLFSISIFINLSIEIKVLQPKHKNSLIFMASILKTFNFKWFPFKNYIIIHEYNRLKLYRNFEALKKAQFQLKIGYNSFIKL